MTLAQKPFLVTHHIANFNSHMPCGSRDTTYLICHMTLQDNVVKVYCDFMEESSSLYVNILRSLVAIGTVVVEI